MYKYLVDMYTDIDGTGNYQWVTDIRFYNGVKDLNDFDLCDVPNKRKNARYIGKYDKITLP